jgi:hypothetical protein
MLSSGVSGSGARANPTARWTAVPSVAGLAVQWREPEHFEIVGEDELGDVSPTPYAFDRIADERECEADPKAAYETVFGVTVEA